MRKVITLGFMSLCSLFIGLGIYNSIWMDFDRFFDERHDVSDDFSQAKTIVEKPEQPQDTDTISNKQAAIAKPQPLAIEDKSMTKLAEEISKNFGLASLNNQILQDIKKLAPEQTALHEYVKDFPFEKLFMSELEKLHPEDLNIIAEVEKHEVSQTLAKKEEEITKLMDEFSKNGKAPKISNAKQELIDEINKSLNSYQSNRLLVGSILQGSLSYSLSLKDEKLNHSEIQAMAKERADQILKLRQDYLKKSISIPYSVLTNDELKEYADYLQKVQASKATKLSTNALIPVFNRFSRGLIDVMKKY